MPYLSFFGLVFGKAIATLDIKPLSFPKDKFSCKSENP